MTISYREIERLAKAIEQYNLKFAVEPSTAGFSEIYYRHVIMQAGETSWRIPV